MYYSWVCEDLDDTVLSAAEAMANPSAASYVSPPVFMMVDRAAEFNIFNYFNGELVQALSDRQDYDSGIIRLCRITTSGGTPTSFYFQVSLRVNGAGQIVYAEYGSGDGTSFSQSVVKQYTSSEFYSLDYLDQCITFVWRQRRDDYTQAASPGYDGYTNVYMVFGPVQKQIGTYEQPSTQYPYGRMRWQLSSYGLISDIPGGATMCYSDNAASIAAQPELRAYALDERSGDRVRIYYDYYGANYAIPAAMDGSYNNDTPIRPDPNNDDPTGPSKPGGGDGDHRQPYTPIPIPGIPTIGPNSAGFVYMLRMTPAQMQQFAVDLVRPTWWTALKNFFADPLDFICGIMIVPYEPVSNYSVYPKFGDNVFEHAYPQVYQQYTVVDCGNLAVPKYFGGALDQNPFTKLLVWLPYIGYRELDADECVGKSLHIVYHCDCLTGDCVCFISTVAGSGYEVPFDRVIAQFSGNCGVRVPFGATSFDAAIAASVQLLGGAVGAIAGGAMGAAIGAGAVTESQIANSIAGTTIGAVQGSKVTTERSGISGASAGYLSIQYPYLLREVPRQSLAKNYMDLEGYPSNVAGPLNNFYGYAAVESIDLNSISATKEELDEIRSILEGGVYI